MILPNGLEVVFENSPPRSYAVVGYWIQVGSAADPAGRSGLVHFVEHLISPHTLAQRPGVRLVTVETSLEYTGALFTVRTGDLPSFLRVHAQSYHRPAWNSKDFDFARNGILRELEFRDRNPVVRLQTGLLEQCFSGHAYGRPVVGSRSCVEGLGSADVVRLMEQEWVSRRALLFIRADLSSEEVGEAVAAAYGGVQRSPRAVPPPTSRCLPRGVRVRLDVDQRVNPYVVVGFPMPGAGEQDYLLFLAALNLLLGASAFTTQTSVSSPPSWLDQAIPLRDAVAGVDVSLSPTRDRFVALAGFRLRSAVDPDTFADEILEAVDHFRRCVRSCDSSRPLGESLRDAWRLATAASSSPWWIDGVHRLLNAPESVLRLITDAPQIAAESLAVFVDRTWLPAQSPVGVLKGPISLRRRAVIQPRGTYTPECPDLLAGTAKPPRPRTGARDPVIVESRPAGARCRYLSWPTGQIAAATIVVRFENASSKTHPAAAVLARWLQAELASVLRAQHRNVPTRAFSLAVAPACDHLRVELSAPVEVFHEILERIIAVARCGLTDAAGFERARADELRDMSGAGVDDLLALIRTVRLAWFPTDHALHHPLPGPQAGVEALDFISTQSLWRRNLAWERLQVGIVGPWDPAAGLESVLDRFSSIPSAWKPAEIEVEIPRTLSTAPETYYAETPGTHDAFVIALPSVSCEDSRYPALAVANALFAQRLRTDLQQRDSRVLWARSFLDRTFVSGLWYIYANTVSADVMSVVERVHELAESIVADGPAADEVEAARRYLWDDRCRTQGPLRRAALAGSVTATANRPLAWEDFLLLDYLKVAPGDVRAVLQERFSRERAVTVLQPALC